MTKADFCYEEKKWREGFEAVVGVDEVGRGSLAGPVVAGAAFVKTPAAKAAILKLRIDDSKRLTVKKRLKLIPQIEKHFLTAIGQATVSEINKLGIVKATHLAMRRALKNFQFDKKYFILVDGYAVKYLPGGLKRQMGIIKGDQKSVSIAAASIVAKVYRDSLMRKLSRDYPVYKWARNKGYGTLVHRRVLKRNGKSEHHRLLFVDGML